MASYHKSRIIEQFNLIATQYDNAAILQKEIGNRLLERLEYIHIEPLLIVDIGCGSGYSSMLLHQKFPKANIISLDISEHMVTLAKSNFENAEDCFQQVIPIIADCDFIPLADQTCDLVFSNFTLEWINDLNPTFMELKRILKPNGLLMFSTYGIDSLAEIRIGIEQYAQKQKLNIDLNAREPYYRDMHNVGDTLFALQFENPVMDVERLTITYNNLNDIIKDLNNTGIYNDIIQDNSFVEQLALYYEPYLQKNSNFPNATIWPVTYEIIYGHAWRTVEEDNLQQACFSLEKDIYNIKIQSKSSSH